MLRAAHALPWSSTVHVVLLLASEQWWVQTQSFDHRMLLSAQGLQAQSCCAESVPSACCLQPSVWCRQIFEVACKRIQLHMHLAQAGMCFS